MLPVSVCMIAKNEEKYIAECLRRLSVYDWEIIVADTGSTDRTVEIAESYHAKVFPFEWVGDFSAARNYSISLAENDCILVVDCDEYLESNAETAQLLAGLPELLKPLQVGMIDRFSLTADSTLSSSVVHEPIARIFRKSSVHYQGTIHEQLAALRGEPLEFISLPLSLQHMGYSTPEIKRAKAERNIAMLEAELSRDSTNPYLLFQLGQSYFGLSQYETALFYFERALGLEVNEQEDYVQTLAESYGYCLLYLKQFSRAMELEGIYSIFSRHADFVFLMGLIYMNNGFFDKAIAEFWKATSISSYSVDGVNSYKAFYNIGVIQECLGNTRLAEDAYQRCGNYPPALKRLGIGKDIDSHG